MTVFATDDRVALYTHLRTFESDFDKSQSQMRALSAAWSTAVLAAVAVVITTGATPIVEPERAKLLPAGIIDDRAAVLAYLRAIICFVGSAGVYAFWYIDQGVYQRLLHSVFAYGLFVESRDPQLPQIRSSMFLANLDVTNRLGTFYRAQFVAFLGLSFFVDVLGRFIAQQAQSPPPEVWYIIGAHLLLVFVGDRISSHTWPSLNDTIADFYPDLANTLPIRPAHGGIRGLIARLRNKPLPVQTGIVVRQSRFDGQADPNLPAFLKRIRHQA